MTSNMQYCKQCQTQSTWSEFEDGLCDGCWFLAQKPQTAGEAQSLAIDWQNWQADKDLSYRELATQQAHFEALAKKFDLVDEFKENGII